MSYPHAEIAREKIVSVSLQCLILVDKKSGYCRCCERRLKGCDYGLRERLVNKERLIF